MYKLQCDSVLKTKLYLPGKPVTVLSGASVQNNICLLGV